MNEANADIELTALAERVAAALTARGLKLACAESCTGGLIAKVLTDRAGSSTFFECGYVVYSNASKHALLGVDAARLARDGAVSESCVQALAAGALARHPVDVALAVSGIAGPSGGTPEKPVGLVWLAWARRGAATQTAMHRFPGDRAAVRQAAACAALEGLLALLKA